MSNLENKKPSELKPWLNTYADLLTEVRNINCTVYEYLYESNKDYPDGKAICYFDTEITFGSLFKNIQQTARALLKYGLKKGDIVTMVSAMTPELAYLFYAMDLIGVTPNMVDPRYSAEGIKEYIEEVDSRFVVTLSVAYDKVKEAVKETNCEQVLVITPVESLPKTKQFAYKLFGKDNHKYENNVILWKDFFAKGQGGEDIVPTYDPQHACIICHTGGTTGSPKGVMLGDRALNAVAQGNAIFRLDRGAHFLDIMPPFIAYGFALGIHSALSFGMQTVIIPQFDPNEFGKLIVKYKPQSMAGVPAHYQILAKDPIMNGFDMSFLRCSACGGDALNIGAEEEINKFYAEHGVKYKITKGYGMTECCSEITTNFMQYNKLGSIGTPLDLATIGIFEPETDNELDFNEEGEICITGPFLMLGYYNKPEATAEVMKMHSDGQIWLHTGDIGHMDEEGFIFLNGRIKRLIIRHDGFKIFPQIIEDVVGSYPDVDTCSAVRIKDADHVQGDLPVVHFTMRKDSTSNAEDVKAGLKKACEEKLAEYVQPVAFVLDEALPYTGIGKIDYRALEARHTDTKEFK